MEKINLAIFFGGKSVEHDVSVITGIQAINNLDKQKYTLYPIYITKEGKWEYVPNITTVDELKKVKRKKVIIQTGNNIFALGGGLQTKKVPIHAALLCMHGYGGEDGILQGILEACNIPYTSCGVLSSALTMDKDIMKRIFSEGQYPILPYVLIKKFNWLKDKDAQIKKCEQLEYPLIIKPSGLGSSIGITLAYTHAELMNALELAFTFDVKVVVEKALTDFYELNCACFKYKNDLKVSLVERPIKENEVLSFEDKYKSGESSKNAKGGQKFSNNTSNGIKNSGMASLSREIPAQIDEKIIDNVKFLTSSVYEYFDCSGVVRCDFMFDRYSERLYINEINAIPGSLSFYLWGEGCDSPMDYKTLLDELIEDAIFRTEKTKSIKRTFNSGLI